MNASLMVKEALFYAGNRLVDSTDPGWTQSVFDTPAGIFDQVGLQKNARKTIIMVYRPCGEAGVWSDEAYTWRMTG